MSRCNREPREGHATGGTGDGLVCTKRIPRIHGRFSAHTTSPYLFFQSSNDEAMHW